MAQPKQIRRRRRRRGRMQSPDKSGTSKWRPSFFEAFASEPSARRIGSPDRGQSSVDTLGTVGMALTTGPGEPGTKQVGSAPLSK